MQKHIRRHSKGQTDHVDAWLMSYADLITLLFMLFVILISVSVSRQNHPMSMNRGVEQEHPVGTHKSGTLELGTSFDEAYRTLVGVIMSSDADQFISLQKTNRGIAIDVSAVQFFDDGSSNIPPAQMAIIVKLAQALKANVQPAYTIEVEGHTSGKDAERGMPMNDWSLAALRAATIVNVLQEEGVNPAQLRATSFAGTQPLVPNRDAKGNDIESNRLRNQRIIIRMETPSN